MRFLRPLGIFNLVLALTAALFLTACEESSNNQTSTGNDIVAKSQVLQIRMTDSPGTDEEFQQVLVNITGIDVHHVEKGWISLPFEAHEYDLMELQNATSVIIFEEPIEDGKYTQIRLHIDESNNEVSVGEKTYPLIIPAGEETGIKLNTPFEIKKGKIVAVTLDFDAERSLHVANDLGLLHPVIKIDSVTEYDGAGLVTENGGHVGSINGDFNIAVPAGATSESVIITMKEVNPATLHGSLPENTTLVGRVYDLGPDGYPFLTNITLEIPYNDDTVNRIGTEGSLHVVTYNEELDVWEPVPTTVVASANVVQAQLSHFSLYALAMEVLPQIAGQQWTAEIDDGVISLINEKIGRIIFSDETVRSVTRTPVTTITTSEAEFSRRPTLYITLCGFLLDSAEDILDPSGSGNCNWQGELEDRLIRMSNPDHQYKHFAVNWDTHASNKTQVFDLTSVVSNFLKARKYAWDVVIIGHSRGGIFAHDLSRELVGNDKIANLHTFLIDPTAGGVLGDNYPVSLYEAYPTVHYGTLLYDNEPWAYLGGGDTQIPMSYGALSDIDIPGYTNYGRSDYYFPNTTHATFPFDWLRRTGAQGWTQALNDILAVKDTGAFESDISGSGMEIVRISRPDDMGFEGNIDFTNGTLRIWGELTINGVPAIIDATFSPDGIQVGHAVGLIGSTQVVVTEDRLVASDSLFLVATYTAIGDGGITSTVDLTLLRTDLTINSEEIYWELQIGGEGISLNLPSDPLGLGVPTPDDVISDVGDAISDLGSSISDALGF